MKEMKREANNQYSLTTLGQLKKQWNKKTTKLIEKELKKKDNSLHLIKHKNLITIYKKEAIDKNLLRIPRNSL